MKVGDLIRLKTPNENSRRWATVIEYPSGLHCMKIMFFDNGEILSALKSNIDLYFESFN